ncbi:hypothetical protein QVD17_20735 [Tagetes erecta]|uniref:Transmembrane protein n=1 Tax=Tagetes erecta TaxID=13708 RepID=A0AAD8KM86_TARER|nr:hypothetical protein QVD17_20735 [Tagetes erecta]
MEMKQKSLSVTITVRQLWFVALIWGLIVTMVTGSNLDVVDYMVLWSRLYMSLTKMIVHMIWNVLCLCDIVDFVIVIIIDIVIDEDGCSFEMERTMLWETIARINISKNKVDGKSCTLERRRRRRRKSKTATIVSLHVTWTRSI